MALPEAQRATDAVLETTATHSTLSAIVSFLCSFVNNVLGLPDVLNVLKEMSLVCKTTSLREITRHRREYRSMRLIASLGSYS